MTRNPFIEPVGTQIVYVREVAPGELPDELRRVPAKLFALHDAEGNRLAIAPDRSQAFALARKNDLKPLSVH